MRRALLFVNDEASQAERRTDEIVAALTAGGLQVECVEVPCDDYAGRLRARLGDADLLVVAGGDGTVRCAAEAIMQVADGRLPLGIVPLGTANNVARSLGLPLTIPAACRAIADGRTVPMDLGRVNGRLFVSVVGIGFSTHVHEHVPAAQKKRWGSLSYAFQAGKLLFHRPPVFRAEIRSDAGTQRVKALQITVCNGRYYGAHLQIHPEASLSDGWLDLSVVESKNWIRGVFKTLLPLPPGHVSPGLRLMRARRFEIVCRPVMKLDVEGAIDLSTPARFDLLPSALQVFAP
ncbi:MAG TPA: YegS/Rv2252/BmrU family lipid kinase [Chthoniobacteraceae bacterium]|jgi:YegS/Rv2252/BmrU family lipid kinase|nr:YegS/Rv2252/BmrU family lipid kinase [Chthoniobacteraceae bacterium]